jgi:hypothetical protein
MSWAARRRFYILAGIGAVVAAFVLILGFATFYQVPSCKDTKQNQGEQGVDCGGPCPYLCSMSVQAPVVEFVRPVSPQAGRTDVIAYVDNQNPSAAVRGATYRIDLYGPDNVVVATKTGTVDLPPKSKVPVYVPDFFSGNQTVAHAFLTFDDASLKWETYNDTRTQLAVESPLLTNTDSAPRVTAVIDNSDVQPLYNVLTIVALFDAAGNAIGASQTVIPKIPAQGSATALFTWNGPFNGAVARIEVTPVLPLP